MSGAARHAAGSDGYLDDLDDDDGAVGHTPPADASPPGSPTAWRESTGPGAVGSSRTGVDRRPAALRAWRRSLRLRVVATTMVLSLIVVTLLGTFVIQRIADGLLDAKVATALGEASAGTWEAQNAFDAADRADDANVLLPLADQVVLRLASGGGSAGRNEVVLVRSPGGFVSAIAPDQARSGGADVEAVPEDLRAAVRAQQRQQWRPIVMADPDDEEGGEVPALAVGSRIVIQGVGFYELYYLFPLDDEAATLSLVQRALAVGGLVLVALIGAVAFIVTRQVVDPVRMAARIASQLAGGDLEQRMRVRGEDDLARLAASFNRMATNLQRQIRQLEELSWVQRRFVSDVSHELRTPLTTIRMAADVLHEARGSFEPAVARSAELLQTQLDRFESLLTDLLEISRFDAGAASLDTDPVDLRDAVRRVLEAHEPLAERKGSEMRLHVPAVPCVAEVDARRVDRILRNLVANAIEHGEGHPVDVTVAADDAAVAVTVRDHGVGLQPGQAALVFGRFWRADPARARTTGGTGLGLSIALEDARLHDGWLQAWGEPGHGALFRLTLPRRAGSSLQSSPLPLEPADSTRRRALAALPAGASASRGSVLHG